MGGSVGGEGQRPGEMGVVLDAVKEAQRMGLGVVNRQEDRNRGGEGAQGCARGRKVQQGGWGALGQPEARLGTGAHMRIADMRQEREGLNNAQQQARPEREMRHKPTRGGRGGEGDRITPCVSQRNPYLRTGRVGERRGRTL